MTIQLIKSENFGSVKCDFWKGKDNEVFMTSEQLGQALGYSEPRKAISNLVNRNEYLKDNEFSGTLKMRTPGGTQNVRVFSEDGIYEVSFLSSTSKAKEFRSFVRKVLKSIRKGELKVIPIDEYKKLEIQARYKNAKAREGKLLLSIIKDYENLISPESKQLILSNVTELVAGQALIPKPVINRTYTAGDIAGEVGISANMIGRIANKHSLKTDEYGMTILDKSPYSNKQVTSFVYNEEGRKKLLEIINKEEV